MAKKTLQEIFASSTPATTTNKTTPAPTVSNNTALGQFDKAKFAQLEAKTNKATGQADYNNLSPKDRAIATQSDKMKRQADSLKNLSLGVVSGFSELGRGIKNKVVNPLLKGVFGENALGAQEATKAGFEQATGADLNTGAGKVGEFIGETLQYATPGGASMAPAKLAFRGGAAGVTEALSGDGVDKGTAVTAGVAAFAPPVISKATSVTANLLKNVAKGTAGVVGGKGSKVIEEIYNNPEAAKQGLRGLVTTADDAITVRKGVANIAKKASDEFADDLDNLPKRLGRAPKVLTDKTKTTIKVDGKTYQLSKQGVKSQLTQALRQFDVTVDPKKKVFDFSEAPLDNAESKRLKEVFSVIDSWTDTTPRGFHKMARKIENFRKPGEQSAELNAIIDSVSRNIRGYIGKRIPAAKEMLGKYAQAKDLIEAFDQELATSGRTIGGTAERIKTEKRVSTLFSGEKDSINDLILNKLPGGKDIAARQAGRMMQEQVSRSASSIGDIARGLVNAVITPKTVGETAAWLGVSLPKAQRFLEQLTALDPVARGAVVSIVVDLMETEPQE